MSRIEKIGGYGIAFFFGLILVGLIVLAGRFILWAATTPAIFPLPQ